LGKPSASICAAVTRGCTPEFGNSKTTSSVKTSSAVPNSPSSPGPNVVSRRSQLYCTILSPKIVSGSDDAEPSSSRFSPTNISYGPPALAVGNLLIVTN